MPLKRAPPCRMVAGETAIVGPDPEHSLMTLANLLTLVRLAAVVPVMPPPTTTTCTLPGGRSGGAGCDPVVPMISSPVAGSVTSSVAAVEDHWPAMKLALRIRSERVRERDMA